jgi:acyl carrier protein
MSSTSEETLINLVTEWVKQNRRTPLSPCEAEINGNTNLLSSGLIDSFGFVDLILYIESMDGYRIDLSDADPNEFAVIRGLCRIALRSLSTAEL